MMPPVVERAIATCQMDAAVAPVSERLERAAALVREAANKGAELVVLPEMFNTGYGYDVAIVRAAEAADGPTATWLADRARTHDLHVAGTFLVHEDGEVWNTLLLVAPDGQTWRYDKVYPWGWERSAFRGSRQRSVVADTELGRVGFLVCWDNAHTDLWAEYAGRVQLMLACSCVADVTAVTYAFDSGESFHASEMAGLGGLDRSAEILFGEMIDEQACWLGVPVVDAGASGLVDTVLPRGSVAALPVLARTPSLVGAMLRGASMRMRGATVGACRVVDPRRGPTATLRTADGEAVAVGAVEVAASCPEPSAAQPATRLRRGAYVLSDRVLPPLMVPVYRRNLELAFGHRDDFVGSGEPEQGGVLGFVRSVLRS
jgi:predicted amidohydrolase